MLNSLSSKVKLPPRYASAKYEDIPTNIRKLVKSMMDGEKGLYLWGDCGTGKTHIAYSVMQRCILKKRSAKIYNSPELLDLIRDFFGKRGLDYHENKLKVLQDFKGLLIIDDLGAEKPTEWVAETFYKLINMRYERNLPTIFTGNLSLDQLAEKIGDRVPSRIAEMCEIVELKGGDRRLG